jgi:hypothetical protein
LEHLIAIFNSSYSCSTAIMKIIPILVTREIRCLISNQS